MSTTRRANIVRDAFKNSKKGESREKTTWDHTTPIKAHVRFIGQRWVKATRHNVLLLLVRSGRQQHETEKGRNHLA